MRAEDLPVLQRSLGWSVATGQALDGTFALARIPRSLPSTMDSLRKIPLAQRKLPMEDVRGLVLELAEAVATGDEVRDFKVPEKWAWSQGF